MCQRNAVYISVVFHCFQRQYPSAYTSTNYTSSLYSPSSVTSSPLSRRRVIDVPISAPWHSSSSSLGRSMSETMNGFNRRVSQPSLWVLEKGKSSPPPQIILASPLLPKHSVTFFGEGSVGSSRKLVNGLGHGTVSGSVL